MSFRRPMRRPRIARMNGAGNKILVLDLRGGAKPPSADEARAIHAAKGLDYDQLMAVADPRTPGTAAYLLIYNNDGTLAGACGNGTRCVADRLCRELAVDRLCLETQAGVIACERLADWSYRVDMGRPRFDWRSIPLARPVDDTSRIDLDWPDGGFELGAVSAVNMGNPHAVFFVPDLAVVDAARLGPLVEVHPLFPEKTNVTFAQINGPDNATARVWERRVGLTLACGSAACATVAAASRRGLMGRQATVRLPGGELKIEWRAPDDHVLMTGPVEFEGEIALDALYEAAS